MTARHDKRLDDTDVLSLAASKTVIPQGDTAPPQVRWAVSAHVNHSAADIRLALTVAESMAFDAGDRGRAIGLGRVAIEEVGCCARVTFTVGPTRDRETALDELRTHLGKSASDLDCRNWERCARTLRAMSASMR